MLGFLSLYKYVCLGTDTPRFALVLSICLSHVFVLHPMSLYQLSLCTCFILHIRSFMPFFVFSSCLWLELFLWCLYAYFLYSHYKLFDRSPVCEIPVNTILWCQAVAVPASWRREQSIVSGRLWCKFVICLLLKRTMHRCIFQLFAMLPMTMTTVVTIFYSFI